MTVHASLWIYVVIDICHAGVPDWAKGILLHWSQICEAYKAKLIEDLGFNPFYIIFKNGEEDIDEKVLLDFTKHFTSGEYAQEPVSEEEGAATVFLWFSYVCSCASILDLCSYSDAECGAYFHPGLRWKRPTHSYAADALSYGSAYEPEKYDRCTKQIMWAASLIPGIFTAVCPHKICYGFVFMVRCTFQYSTVDFFSCQVHHESPRTLFNLLYHRLKTPGRQKFVVYDNGCHSDRYCRSREPAFFANLKHRIDRLHYKGHCVCCEGYHLSTYDAYDAVARDFNSQVQWTMVWLNG